MLDTMAGDFTTGRKEDALGLSFGLGILDVIASLFVDAGVGSFRDRTVDLLIGGGGVIDLVADVCRVDAVRAIENCDSEVGSCGGTDLHIHCLLVRQFNRNYKRIKYPLIICCGGGGEGELGADTGGVIYERWEGPWSRVCITPPIELPENDIAKFGTGGI